MLVLARFEGETVLVSPSTEISILSVKQKRGKFQVRLGFTAPLSTNILRGELCPPRDSNPNPEENTNGD